MNSTYVLCPVPESDEFLRLKRKPSRTEYAYGDVEVTIGYVDAKESPWHFRPRFSKMRKFSSVNFQCCFSFLV